MDEVFRNRTNTKQKIQMISALQINTKDEAIAFLKAISGTLLQITNVINRDRLNDIYRENAAQEKVKAEEVKEEVAPIEVVPEAPVVPNFEEEEKFTEEQVQARVAALKKAKSKK